jgi:hypothetical protein
MDGNDAQQTVLNGGCQCGAVRYRVTGPFRDPHICHCRMCQRAVGGPFVALASVPLDRMAWTGRSLPSMFRSSSMAERGFCQACGTPLTFRYLKGQHVNFTLPSLDNPSAIVPERQYGIESRLDWTCTIAELPGSRTEDDVPPNVLDTMVSCQACIGDM